MDEDDSSFASAETPEQPPPTPSCSNESDDSRIKCKDQGSLKDIMKVTLAQISELADLSVDDTEDFIIQFNKSFKSALLENIVVNDLPLVLDSSKLSSSQTEGEKLIVDNNALCAQLSSVIKKTALKRKYYPAQCSRIMRLKLKHEFLNLKKAKVIDSSQPKKISEDFKQRNYTKRFNEFCNDFKTIQERVQYKTKTRKELEMKISLASDIQRSQKGSSKS